MGSEQSEDSPEMPLTKKRGAQDSVTHEEPVVSPTESVEDGELRKDPTEEGETKGLHL